MEILHTNSLNCRECKKSFSTRDAADEVYPICKECLKRRKDIWHEVDEKIQERRKNKPVIAPTPHDVSRKRVMISRQDLLRPRI